MKERDQNLINYIKPYKLRLAQAAFSMMFLAGLRGAVVYILGPIIDKVFVQKDLRVLKTVLIVLPAVFILRAAFQYINAYLMSWVGQKAVQKIRADVFKHVHRLSADFYWKYRSSDVMARVINDLNNVQSTIQFIPLYLVRDILTVTVLIGVLFYIHWKFALISLVIIPVASVILKILSRKMRKAGRESQALIGEISHKFQESLQGILIVKAFNYEKTAIRKFTGSNDDYFSKIMRYLRATVLSSPLMDLVGGLVLTLMIYLGAREIFAGGMTTGMFFSFVASFFTAYTPLKNISNLNAKLQLGLASWERIWQILREKPTVVPSSKPVRIERIRGEIEFKNVSYKYPSRPAYVLKNVSFKVNPGEAVAFVGPSGAGKTTIIHLVLRFFNPVSGGVFVDGHNIREVDMAGLRNHMGLVTQDTVLFDDTVRNNIALGKENAGMDEIREAAALADADRFIRKMPDGYETVLGERGVKLSGGQKQRLAIARALLNKPKILLLDEATSNLDTQSERAVQKAVENSLKGRTVIMVAHRLSTVRKADKIIVLKDAGIAEAASHDDLISLDGIYRELYEAQK